MRTIIICCLLTLATGYLFAQPTPKSDGADCGAPPTECDNKEFRFTICKPDGSSEDKCSSNPWVPVGNKPASSRMLVCYNLPDNAVIPTYLTRSQIQKALDVAAYEWNCICGLENQPIPDKKCCFTIYFFFNPREAFGDPKYNLGFTPGYPQCGDADGGCYEKVISINATDSLFNRLGEWKTDNTSSFNLTAILQHEGGHDLGMMHLNGEEDNPLPCQNSTKMGIMNRNALYDKTKRSVLTNDDKCYFKMLYCPNGPIGDVNNGNQISMNLPPYPNPARDIVTIKFSLTKPSSIKIAIYNAKGEKIYTALDIDNFPVGENSLHYNTLLTENGNYFYTVEIGAEKRTEKFVVKR